MSKLQTHPRKPPAGGHTIAVVAERTGLSRDVLRVWERRYGAVEPERSAGGQRLYTDVELARFQLLARATRLGRTIGSVARLPTEELERMLATDEGAKGAAGEGSLAPLPENNSPHTSGVVERALAHTLALDAARLDAELRGATARYGLPLLLKEIVPTLMHRIGDEWMADRLGIPHEHLASAVVLAILLDAIRTLPEAPDAPRLLVATPAGEQHVIGAALIAAAAAVDGWSILFLGANVPSADLASAARERKARAVALSIVVASEDVRLVGEVRQLRRALADDVPIVVGGAAAIRLRDVVVMPGVAVCNNLEEAQSLLAQVVLR